MTTISVNPAAPAAIKEDHDLVGYNGVIVDNIDKFFVNADSVNCPLTKCALMEKGCSNPQS